VQGHDRVKFATSVIDYVFRALGVEYLNRDDLAHVTPEAVAVTPAANRGADPTASSPSMAVKAAQKPSDPPPPRETLGMGDRVEALPTGKRKGAAAQDELLGQLSGDAPFCDGCGHITVRNGTCFKCLNCGNSMGCS